MSGAIRRALWAGAALCSAAAACAADHCDMAWRITPRLDALPRHLDVQMSFDTGPRTQTELELPSEWAGANDYLQSIGDLQVVGAGPRITDTDKPHVKRISHRRGERVTLRFTVATPAPALNTAIRTDHRNFYRTLLGGEGFQLFGNSVLPSVDAWNDDSRPRMCLSFNGLQPGDWLATSHGTVRATQHTFRVRGSPVNLRQAFYAGGPMQVRERHIEGRPLVVVMHAGAASTFRFTPDQFADAVASVIGTHRRFWRDHEFPYQLVTLQPNHDASRHTGGTAVFQAFAMHASDDFSVPGEAFEHLVAHEHLHNWIPRRLGAMQYEGVDDEALRYWFSEGFTDFYTHRLLVASGAWTLDDYARTLNEKLRSYLASPARLADNQRVLADFFRDQDVGRLPYQRGEVLALRWHAALQAQGAPGLDAVMRSLVLPSREAGTGAAHAGEPLVVERLLTAFDASLRERAQQDVATFVERGELLAFDADTLGPCFTMEMQAHPVWQLGFDRASTKAMKLSGVDPEGPAFAAGLREGQTLVGFSIHGGDLTRDALIQVQGEDGRVRDVSYRPVAKQPLRTPVYRPRPDGLNAPQCKAWFGL